MDDDEIRYYSPTASLGRFLWFQVYALACIIQLIKAIIVQAYNNRKKEKEG